MHDTSPRKGLKCTRTKYNIILLITMNVDVFSINSIYTLPKLQEFIYYGQCWCHVGPRSQTAKNIMAMVKLRNIYLMEATMLLFSDTTPRITMRSVKTAPHNSARTGQYLFNPVKHAVHPNNIKISYLSKNITSLLQRLQSHDAHQINNLVYPRNHMELIYCLTSQFSN